MKVLKLIINNQVNYNSNKWFTLVELIVVITILAILWAIAFISLQSYTLNARNWTRLSDLNNIKKSLELFIIEKWYYPNPDLWSEITYSGWLAWIQWTIWTGVTTNMRNLNKKPVDPLLWNEYTYSLINLKTEYQLASIYEWWVLFSDNIVTSVHATWEKNALAMLVWNYNWFLLKVSTWWIDYIVAIPSIINSDMQELDLSNIINRKTLSYDKYWNLPSSYKDMWYTMTWWFDFIPQRDIILHSWSLDDLGQDWNKLVFIDNLKNVYNWTILQGNSDYKAFISIDTINDPAPAIELVNNYLNSKIWWLNWWNLIIHKPITYENCTLNWETILHKQRVTAYSEDSITPSQSYECEDRSQERVCFNWSLSWNDFYKYSNCWKLPINPCSSNPHYIYNNHDYSIPNIAHANKVTNIISTNISENNWIFNYTLTNIGCNDWVLINVFESPTPNVVSCNTWFGVVWNSCVQYWCITKPDYLNAIFTVWNPTTPNQSRQNGNSMSPCFYTCKTWYTWIDCNTQL